MPRPLPPVLTSLTSIDRPALQFALKRGADRLTGAVLRNVSVRDIGPILVGLALVAAVTIVLLATRQVVRFQHTSLTPYLIPIVICAVRWGTLPAVVSAVAGVTAATFFFYQPPFSFKLTPPQFANLVLFITVAVVIGRLTRNLAAHVRLAEKREQEIKALHFFSRRLAVASGPDEIYAAIQQHLSEITGYRVVFFAGEDRNRAGPERVPDRVHRAVRSVWTDKAGPQQKPIIGASGTAWLVRALSQRGTVVGVLAIELGRGAQKDIEDRCAQIDAALGEATATLERMDVAHAIGEARLRSESELLREALIGSVSHELRTPLASILGSASILVQAPAIAQDARLSGLAGVVHDEAERLNSEIQNLLDASRISSAGVRPNLEWVDPADIDQSEVDKRASDGARRIEVDLPDNLPFIRVDHTLVRQALAQVLDNALKYSPSTAPVRIAAKQAGGHLRIDVSDEGDGLSEEERARIWDRFYRAPRHQSGVAGSGLGLWIARAFVNACGGEMSATSPGRDRGTTITLSLPAPPEVSPEATAAAAHG